ncbi:MAG TPA: succinylglutamate desuccinylase/aspartoacylase family protein [Candidatus Limnocylindria bacterium]|nr:succinylglutamate desuccinylase/aspartoacylase family protein [Candidatus Limnocylindria bacterium]
MPTQRMIGPIEVPAAGQRTAGHFTFAGDDALAKYTWPYFAIAGTASGPTVLITGGVHAAEYTGIEAALRLGRSLDPQLVRGTVLVLPLINRPGFFERSIYVNPEDGDNLNRVFPGDPTGTWSQRFAHRLTTEVIQRCDNAIDLHAGDLIEDLIPFVIYRQTGDAALDARIRTMAHTYGAPWAVTSSPTGERPGSLYAVAASMGVASMLAESGGRGLLVEEDVVRHVRGVTNVLRAIGALAGEPEPVPPTQVLQSFDWLRSPVEGIFRSRVQVGQQVSAGDDLGAMVDLLGEPLAAITAPVTGIVLFVVTSPAIKADGLLLAIGRLS